MANIFTNAVKYLGDTLQQVATPDNLRDFRHASRLFVDSNFRFMPKYGTLFHVFFDINPEVIVSIDGAADSNIATKELGMLVKAADLPKFTIDTKTYNSYNRPNIVQSKIKFDPIQITFHDDSANIVRDFWYKYFRYYYRDSDYSESFYQMPYKYTNQDRDFSFGYGSRVGQETQKPYLNAVRIYSLHQKRFSEYTLIKPIIRSFRHSQHQHSGDSNLMQHEMMLDYENVIYSGGTIGSPSKVKGFADLHYDLTPSPLRLSGGARSIFGTNGLLDTAGDVLKDFDEGNYGAAIFKAARGINTARSMNLKRAAVSELTSIYTQAASQAITGQISTMISGSDSGANNNRPVQISSISTIPGGTRASGIDSSTSVAALAGAAILLNSRPLINQPRRSTIQTLNDRTPSQTVTNQQTLDQRELRRTIGQEIVQIDSQLAAANNEYVQAKRQVANTAQAQAQWAAKYTTLLISTDPDRNALLVQAEQQRQEYQQLNLVAQETVVAKQTLINQLNDKKNALARRREQIKAD